MGVKQNSACIKLVILYIIIGTIIGCVEQPSITKKYLPAQAAIISSQKIKVQTRGGFEWKMQHEATFTLDERYYNFYFVCQIGSYKTGDTIDIFYNPKRPETVVVYSIPEKALMLAGNGEHDHIYFNYDDAKAFFDSIHIHSKRVVAEGAQ